MQSVNDYIPPSSEDGMRCVSMANQSRVGCQSHQRISITQCVDEASNESEVRFKQAQEQYTYLLEDYINANEQYDYDYDHYLEQKRLVQRDGELEYIQCSGDIKLATVESNPKCKKFLTEASKRVKKLPEPEAPRKPRVPNIDAIYNGLVRNCNEIDNGCQQSFEASYRSCGGTINRREVCVKNCD